MTQDVSLSPALRALAGLGVSVDQACDPFWRLNHLYTITTDKGEKIPFRMNEIQVVFYRSLWTRSVILKSRQHGFCLDPQTRVLTADLRWQRIADLQPGQQVVAVDEHVPGGRGSVRRMRTGTVIAAVRVWRKAYRVTFNDGRSVVCTGQHPWLSKNAGPKIDWRTIESGSKKKLRVGTWVRWVTKPWGEATAEDGWFGGMLDGEGSLKTNGSVQLAVSQVAGPVLDRLARYCSDRSIPHGVDSDDGPRKTKFGARPVHALRIGRMDEMFRVIGQTRPTRFIGRRWWEGRALPGKRTGEGWARIVSIEPMVEQEMIDLQTTTGTYIAEGFVSHNTTLIDLMLLDQCIFVPNMKAGIIAHTLDDAAEIFRTKVMGPWKDLDPSIRAAVPLTKDTQGELVWANGSSLTIDTSYRSGTLQYLHVSEMGKIGKARPDVAQEIMRGAAEAVAAGNFMFIESTAEGRGGAFYELCKLAVDTRNLGRRLTRLDWRFHFFPWWAKPSNRLGDDEWPLIPIPSKFRKYFEDVERETGTTLDPAQRAWYVQKHAQPLMGDEGMWQEHPSTEAEPFQVAAKGTYFAHEMAMLRKRGQIGKFPWIPGVPVNTFWDWGLNDTTFPLFHQRVHGMDRFCLSYENNGEPPSHYRWFMDQTGYRVWGKHYVPFDFGQRRTTANAVKTLEQLFNEAGIAPTVLIDRVLDKRISITRAREVLPVSCFDAEDAARIIECLDNYSKEWDQRQGVWRDQPRHDAYSNGADAYQTFAMAHELLKHLGPQEKAPQANWLKKRAARARNWRTT